MREAHSDPFGELLLKALGEAAGREPEIERRVGEGAHLLLVEYASGVIDPVARLERLAAGLEPAVILGDQSLDLLSGLRLVVPCCHD